MTDSKSLQGLLGGTPVPDEPQEHGNAPRNYPEIINSGSGGAEAAANQDRSPGPIPGVMTEPEIAALFDLGQSTVRQCAREGTFVRYGRGRYDVRVCLLNYTRQLREHAAKVGRPVSIHNDELKAEKIRQTKAAAEKLELSNQQARGELVLASAVEREWASVLRDVRSALLAVPSRVGSRLPHLTPHDIAEIDREIRATLEGLSDDD